MADLEYYTKNHPTPALSMIADCGFPVCYGEKGIVEGKTVSLGTMSESVLEFYGGSAGNIIPDKAVLAVKNDSITEKQLEELKGLKQPSTEESLIRVEKKEDQMLKEVADIVHFQREVQMQFRYCARQCFQRKY